MLPLTRWTVVAAGMLAVLVAVPSAMAGISILRADGSQAPPHQASKLYNIHTGGWDIHLQTLYAPGGVTSYTIRADGGEIIDNLWIDVPCWEDSEGNCIPAGSPVFVRLYSDGPLGLRSIGNIEQLGTSETLLMHAEVTHDIGSVSVQTIGTLIAGRDVIGPIQGTTLDNPHRGVQTVIAGRDVRGDISATRGRVEHIQAGRNIGSAFNPVTIHSKYGHLSVDAVDDLHADIVAGYADGPGYVGRMHCRRLFGTIRTTGLGSMLLSGRIEITDEFHGSIIIGGSLADFVDYIQLPPQGLTGQIILNADNHPDAIWEAPIYLGPLDDPDTIVLTGPLYEQHSDDLGGGAIGMAPFRLHEQSCTPANGATVTLAPGQPSPTIALQHYGPIIWHFGQPVTIERRPTNTEAPFASLSATDFTIYRSEVNPTRLIIAPGAETFQAGYDYRIRPTSQLRCDIDGQVPVHWQQDYVISIIQPSSVCIGNLNGDSSVDVSDLLVLLSAWGPAGLETEADLTGDGVVDVSDLLQLLGNWGPCTAFQQQDERVSRPASPSTAATPARSPREARK